jgi:hypothetical protein
VKVKVIKSQQQMMDIEMPFHQQGKQNHLHDNALVNVQILWLTGKLGFVVARSHSAFEMKFERSEMDRY